MADFVVRLWESIFTPGTTPTLLLATNASFAALESLLVILFAATRNMHFAALFTIAGGLWYSINWFVRELAKHAAEEEEKKRAAESSTEVAPPRTTDDSDTEVEGAAGGRKKRAVKPVSGSSQVETEEQRQEADLRRRVAAAESASESKNEESSVSTEDEWEKVSEAENEKEK